MAGKRILVVGAGFGGLYAALNLRRAVELGHRVTVVNPENFMQYQPFLPEVASGTIDPRAVVVPLRRVLRHCEVVIGEVERVDHDERRARVRLADGRPIEIAYDVVALAPGSWARVLPIPGLAEHGVGFKTVQEAIWLRNHVLSRLDVAAATDDPERRRAALTFVFVGGGYAGVEALGELEDLARDALESYPGLRPDQMRWVLVEATGSILPEIGSELADYARERLEERGIEVLLDTRLESAEGGALRLSDGQVFRADTLAWTAGVKPSPLAAESGFPVDAAGRIRADAYLRVEGVDDAWAAGDAAAVPDRFTGGAMPPTAQHGMRQGKRLAANLLARAPGRKTGAVRVPGDRGGGVARPLQGGRRDPRGAAPRLPGLVRAPFVPPVRDADAHAQGEDRRGLDGGAPVPEGPRAARLARASARAVRARRQVAAGRIPARGAAY